MWPKYKSDLRKCLTKITSFSKLRNILVPNSYIFIFNKKNAKSNAGQRDINHFKTGLHTNTRYSVQTPNLNLILTFLNKKVTYYFFKYLTIKY